MNRNKVFREVSALILAISIIFTLAVPAFAFNGLEKLTHDDAYVIGRKASYVNPDTGLTADGGDDSPIGGAMSNNLVDKKMMVEKKGGKLYVTFSMVGMIFSKDFKVEIIDKDGKFRTAEHAVTYTSQTESLGTQHFRIEVKPTDKYISPSLFVYAMGRRVQFFITPDFSSAKPGCGPFVSEFFPGKYERETQKDLSGFLEMIPGNPNMDKDTGELTTTPKKPAEPATEAPTQTTAPATTVPETTVPVTVPATTLPPATEAPATTEASAEAEDGGIGGGTIALIVIAVIVIAGVITGIVIYSKKRSIV